MPECEAAHFWVGQKAEPHILLGAPWAEKIFEGSSSEGLHTPAGVHVSEWFSWFFNRPLWWQEKSRGRGGRRMGLVCSAGRQHSTCFSFKILKGNQWHSSYRCCTYQLAEGDFCFFLCAGHLAVPADLSGVVLHCWWWRGDSAGVLGNAVVFLKGLPSSHPLLLGGLQETVPCLLLSLLAVLQVRLFSWKDWFAAQTEILLLFFSPPRSFSKGNKGKEKVIVQLESSRLSFHLCYSLSVKIWNVSLVSYYSGFTTMGEEFDQVPVIFVNCL